MFYFADFATVISKVLDIALYLIGPIVAYMLGRWDQRGRDFNARFEKLEDRIWEFSRLSHEYWNSDATDPRSAGLAAAIKNLDMRIGSDIYYLNRNYFLFRFSNHEQRIALRVAATGSGFESKDRKRCSQRGDCTQKAARKLIDDLHAAKKSIIWAYLRLILLKP